MRRRHFLQISATALATSLARPLYALPSDHRYFSTIGLQLWTVRDQMKKDTPGTIKAIAEAGYRQVEIGDVLGSDELIHLAKENGMNVTSSFVDWQRFADPKSENYEKIDPIIDKAAELGLKHLVFGYIGKGFRETADQLKRIAELCNKAGEKCRSKGIQLCYHNHAFEFEKIDGDTTGYDVLIKEFDTEGCKFELDVFWAKLGGWDPIETMRKLDGRISQLHLKDIKADTPTIYDEGEVPKEAFKELGNGTIDFAEILDVAEEIGVDQCHVEQDQSPAPLASIAESMTYLTKL